VFFGSRDVLVYGLAVGLVFHLVVWLYEEPILAGKFGEEYRAYCREVGRWLPRWRRRGA
jgi:protein-S-isoprenylcysteine O-methyltransferase Ste14